MEVQEESPLRIVRVSVKCVRGFRNWVN